MEYRADKGGIPHKTKPSELFKRQVNGTFQQSPTAMRLLEFRGAGQSAVGDGLSPSRQHLAQFAQVIEETMGHLPPEVVRTLTHDNAAKLYGVVTHEVGQELAAA
ncbi:MAG: hydrolase [Sphingomonas bacterium]|jgi:hypothetical protein|nr:hydrolase [Sphingomonas bacterium]